MWSTQVSLISKESEDELIEVRVLKETLKKGRLLATRKERREVRGGESKDRLKPAQTDLSSASISTEGT